VDDARTAGDSQAAAPLERLHGTNFVVDHFVPGENVQCVLSRAQHEVRAQNTELTCGLHTIHVYTLSFQCGTQFCRYHDASAFRLSDLIDRRRHRWWLQSVLQLSGG
jgi:hypothetical protein